MFEEEKDYYQALGLEPPEGENEQEPAEPAEEDPIEDIEDIEGREEPGDQDDPEEDGEEPEEMEYSEGPKEQTKEERARNAARRRQQERDEYARQAVERAKAEAAEEVRDLFEKAGFRDGDTPIRSLDEMKAYLEKQQGQKISRELKSGKLTKESLQELIAQEIQKQQPEQPDAAFMQRVENELAEIRKYEPSVKEIKDLLDLDRRDAFLDAVNNHGYGYLDAYRFVYADKIAGRGARQEAQRALNNERSKNHLRASGSKGAGDVTVPAQVERNIRALMPNATAKEIRAYYQKDAKRFG